MLPSVLPARPALSDIHTTSQQVKELKTAKVTTPQETAIFICALQDCHKLFPSRERLMAHRKREHSSDDESNIITWNE
ncbi:hypothetical protein BDP27DRAFT_1255917 [Rhodocollybia butyracea]|uniref:C2H2-type domain-containing protein n=1 Tax=Rhodocollybia butyracea TaxID=206335 RepID=A0A9P5Q0L1_9AGAR|nr:hypothetical protein BDP27DRAFT_1255917 [Rhodocollybia butyracea]